MLLTAHKGVSELWMFPENPNSMWPTEVAVRCPE